MHTDLPVAADLVDARLVAERAEAANERGVERAVDPTHWRTKVEMRGFL